MREICTSGSTRGEEPQGYPVAPSPTLPARKRGTDSRRVTEPRASASGPSTNSASTSEAPRGLEVRPPSGSVLYTLSAYATRER